MRVGVDGVSAAGKTTFADNLAEVIREHGRPVIRTSVGEFHHEQSIHWARGRDSPEGFYLDTFNYKAFRTELLEPLGPEGNLHYRTGVHDGGEWLKRPRLSAAPNAVLVCGCIFALRPELNDCWDFRVFLDVDHEETLRRAVERDSTRMGTAAETRARYEARYIPGERMYLDTVHPHELADIVIDNRDPDMPKLLVGRSPK